MPIIKKTQITGLKGMLQERVARLLAEMDGQEVPEAIASGEGLPGKGRDYRYFSGSDVRVAVDDFATVLREIKATLGKR